MDPAKEVLIAEAAHKARLENMTNRRLIDSIGDLKAALIGRLQRVELLLIQIDRKMLWERNCLVNLLSYVGSGIEMRESSTKTQLA